MGAVMITDRVRSMEMSWQHGQISCFWSSVCSCQHRVDLTPMVCLVVEEFNSAESLWLLYSR